MNRAPVRAPSEEDTENKRRPAPAKGFTVGLVLICAAALIFMLLFQGRPAGFSGFTVDADAEDGTKAADASGYWSADGKININKAPSDMLEMLPGIGPALAKRIIEGRPYENIEALTRVSGIGDATFEKLKELICTE
jgi:competence ComEA-like helix-hairpin-helix protein